MVNERKRPRRTNWVELRTAQNKLACRYDPERRLIEYVHRGTKTVFDLLEIERQILANETKV
jgi:hypothetical protein